MHKCAGFIASSLHFSSRHSLDVALFFDCHHIAVSKPVSRSLDITMQINGSWANPNKQQQIKCTKLLFTHNLGYMFRTTATWLNLLSLSTCGLHVLWFGVHQITDSWSWCILYWSIALGARLPLWLSRVLCSGLHHRFSYRCVLFSDQRTFPLVAIMIAIKASFEAACVQPRAVNRMLSSVSSSLVPLMKKLAEYMRQ